MSNGGDCRTAPATPGLLIIEKVAYSGPLAHFFARLTFSLYIFFVLQFPYVIKAAIYSEY